MDRRHFIGLSGSALALMGLSRAVLAAPAADIKATLNVFRPATDTDIQLTEAAMARFAQKFPNVTVSPQYVPTNPWGEYINQLMNGIGGSSSPDVVMMATEGVSTLGSRKILRDIMPFVDGDPSGKQLFDGIEPNLMNGLKYGDTLSYIPNEWNTVVTYYNTAAFEAAGVAAPPADWDWDKFLEIAKALTITDGAGNVTRYGYMIPGGQFALNPWFLNNGTDRLTPDGHESNVRDPRFRETLEFLHALIFEHKVSPTFVRNEQGVGPFIAGQAAMFAGTHGRIPEMIAADLKTVAVQYFPKKTDQVAIMGVGGFGITEASANPELAWEFIKELTGHENSEALARLMRSLPPQREAATSPEYVAYPANSEIFYGSAPIARSIAQPPNFAEVEAITMRHIESYLTGNTEIAPTIDALDDELSRAMSRVRW
jgi:multiple sugar transport system substrate-binding protein